MSSDGSVSRLIWELKRSPDQAAAQRLFQRYFGRLIRLAKAKLSGAPRRASDEEDVAITAIAGLFAGIQQGRFSRLHDRDDLWEVLMMLVDRRAVDQRRKETSQKAGGGHVQGESALNHSSKSSSHAAGIQQVADREPTPEEIVEVEEALRNRLGQLEPRHRQIAIWRLEGQTNEEIARLLGCVTRTVERALSVIRTTWGKT